MQAFIGRSQVREELLGGASKTTLWRLERDGDFPPSVQVTRRLKGYPVEDVEEWRRLKAEGASQVWAAFKAEASDVRKARIVSVAPE